MKKNLNHSFSKSFSFTYWVFPQSITRRFLSSYEEILEILPLVHSLGEKNIRTFNFFVTCGKRGIHNANIRSHTHSVYDHVLEKVFVEEVKEILWLLTFLVAFRDYVNNFYSSHHDVYLETVCI